MLFFGHIFRKHFLFNNPLPKADDTMEKKTITIKEEDWAESVFRTKALEDSVEIKTWTHDDVKKEYIIEYEEKV